MYLEKIDKPQDVKELNIQELEVLSEELREALLFKLSKKGGHNGPNLGIVELTIALHYVFNSPIDKMVFDVSHQTYIHKMLTGRKDGFTDENKFSTISGYTNPNESEHDFFTIGHTSTSISLANGMAKARDLKEDKENIIAIIGDGSLSGGEALEGLNNVGQLNSNMIIIVNDNDQSIAENHGGMYTNLRELREGNGEAKTNLFTAMNLDYLFVGEGNNIEELIQALRKVKDSTKPVVVHIATTKGKGYKPAEENREKFHAGGPIDLEKGEYKFINSGETYTSKTAEFLKKKMKADKTVSLITAGTPSVLAFDKISRDEFKKQFIDVGIAEEHAVAMASGLAKNNTKPVFGVFSTFLQRTYDQISHDLCLNGNPATILVYGASHASMTDATHLCYFDIAMISNIPNLVYLAPTTMEEHTAMMEWAIEQSQHPVAIRVPFGEVKTSGIQDETDYSKLNKYQVVEKGAGVAIIGLGNFYHLAKEVHEELKDNHNIDATLINPKFITGIDKDLLEELKETHDMVITIEDGQLEGGFGSKIMMYYSDSDVKGKAFGFDKTFEDRYNPIEFLKENNVTLEDIVQYIISNR